MFDNDAVDPSDMDKIADDFAKQFRADSETQLLKFFAELGEKGIEPVTIVDGKSYLSSEVVAFVSNLFSQLSQMTNMMEKLGMGNIAGSPSTVAVKAATVLDVAWCLAEGRPVNPTNV